MAFQEAFAGMEKLFDPLASPRLVGLPKPSKLRGWHAALLPTRPRTGACEAVRVLPVVPSILPPRVCQRGGFACFERSR